MTRFRWGLAFALSLSLLLKLAVWSEIREADPGRFEDKDTSSYWQPALALLETGRFSVSPEKPDEPDTFRTPGYPAFLAAAASIVGPSLPAIVILQIALSLLVIVFTALLALELAAAPAACAAALLMALDPVSLALSEVILSETLFALLLTAAALAAGRLSSSGGRSRAALITGTLIALAAFVRPIAQYLGPVIAFSCLSPWAIPAASRRRRFVAASLVLLPVVLLLGGWLLRNAWVARSPTISTVEDEIVLLRAGLIIARRDARPPREVMKELRAEVDRESLKRGLGPRGRAVVAHMKGLRIILSHPLLFLATSSGGMMLGPGEHRLIRLLGYPKLDSPGLDLRGVISSWAAKRMDFGDFARKWLTRPSWPLVIFLFAAAVLAVTDLGVLIWSWHVLRRRRPSGIEFFLLTILAYFFAVAIASSRFRAPLMPILTALAGAGLLPDQAQRGARVAVQVNED